jgi:DNA-binding NarL/FixJ family response regulator
MGGHRGREEWTFGVRPTPGAFDCVGPIVIIDPHVFFRSCWAHALSQLLPSVEFECVDSVAAVVNASPLLVCLGFDGGEDEVADAPATVVAARRIAGEAPLCALLRRYNERLVRCLTAAGVAAVIMPSSTLRIAMASVLVLLGRGAFVFESPACAVNFSASGGRVDDDARPSLADPCFVAAVAMTASRPNDIAPKAIEVDASAAMLPQPRLTPRQRQVLLGLRDGKQNKAIAYDLNVSESAVKLHVRELMRKCKACNRTQVVLRLGEAACAAPPQHEWLDSPRANSSGERRSHGDNGVSA